MTEPSAGHSRPATDSLQGASAAEQLQIDQEQRDIERAGSLHWFHWLVLALSFVLTVLVWQFSRTQLQNKVESRFGRYAEQTINLVAERLQKYEDALWSGTAAMRSHGGTMSLADWQVFANSLELPEKYPGINGMGVIRSVARNNREAVTAALAVEQPGFRIFPEHENDELMPIIYVVPMAENAAAIGLDMAHESNRYTAANKARVSGEAQITGPIVLVQDAGQTPGFLFYAPFYNAEKPDSEAARRREFAGLVYAPFVMNKLLDGTLAQERRQIGITIRDSGALMYDENVPGTADFDAEPILTKRYSRQLYGRTWNFDVRSTQSFRTATSSSQPNFILAGGLLLESLLVTLFLLLSRANRRAIKFAQRMSKSYAVKSTELQTSVDRLEASNEELAQFAFVASHDLQEPLRTLNNYAGLLSRTIPAEQQTGVVADSLEFINSASDRMRKLVVGLLSYSSIGQQRPERKRVDCNALLERVIEDLASKIDRHHATVTIGPLPEVNGFETELGSLFQNLISNAVKFSRPNVAPEISITAEMGSGETAGSWHFQVQDNGMGIAPEASEQVFKIFKRLHTREAIEGSGIGLSNCRKIVTLHGGKIWVEPAPDEGSIFHVTLPV